jgi:hypothetical protein
VLVRLALQNTNDANLKPGQNVFPFDPTAGPGYVWHCHILDHEDNDMMRPMVITFKDLPSLNSATKLPQVSPNANYPARDANATPASTAPAHNHNGSTPTTEQKSAPAGMPMPMPEQQQQPQR